MKVPIRIVTGLRPIRIGVMLILACGLLECLLGLGLGWVGWGIRTVSRQVVGWTTLWPRKNVAKRFGMKACGISGFLFRLSRLKPVSSRKRKQHISVNPSSPTVHQNSTGKNAPAEMNPEKVGPAMVPNKNAMCSAVKARPRWCRKKRSVTMRGPRTVGTAPKKPENSRDMMYGM